MNLERSLYFLEFVSSSMKWIVISVLTSQNGTGSNEIKYVNVSS